MSDALEPSVHWAPSGSFEVSYPGYRAYGAPNPDSLLYRQLSGLDTVAAGIVPIAHDLLDPPSGSIVGVFGSVARDALHPGSDLDVLVIDTSKDPWIDTWRSALETATGVPVNILYFTPGEWEAAANNGERIVAEIRRDAVMLQGSVP